MVKTSSRASSVGVLVISILRAVSSLLLSIAAIASLKSLESNLGQQLAVLLHLV